MIIFAPESRDKEGARYFWNRNSDWEGRPPNPATVLANKDSGVHRKSAKKTHLRSQGSRKKRPRSKTSDDSSESPSVDSESSSKPVVHKPRAQPKFAHPRKGLDEKADKRKERTGIKPLARSNVDISEAWVDDGSGHGNGSDMTRRFGKRSNGLETSHPNDRDSSSSERPAPKMVVFDPSAAGQSGGVTSRQWSQSLQDTGGWKYHDHYRDAPPPHQMYDRHYNINQGQNGYYPPSGPIWYATNPNQPPPLRQHLVYQGQGGQNRMMDGPSAQRMPQNGFHPHFNQRNLQNQQSGPY